MRLALVVCRCRLTSTAQGLLQCQQRTHLPRSFGQRFAQALHLADAFIEQGYLFSKKPGQQLGGRLLIVPQQGQILAHFRQGKPSCWASLM